MNNNINIVTDTSDLTSTTHTKFYDPSFDLNCLEAAKRIFEHTRNMDVDVYGYDNMMELMTRIMREEIIGNVNFTQS